MISKSAAQPPRRPGVFGVVHVDNTLRPLRRITRLIGGAYTRSTLPNPPGSLAKMTVLFAGCTPPNTPGPLPSPTGLRIIAQGSQNPGHPFVATSSSRRTPTGFRPFKSYRLHPRHRRCGTPLGFATKSVPCALTFQGSPLRGQPFARMRKAFGLQTCQTVPNPQARKPMLLLP
jgi:hypothetical protein